MYLVLMTVADLLPTTVMQQRPNAPNSVHVDAARSRNMVVAAGSDLLVKFSVYNPQLSS